MYQRSIRILVFSMCINLLPALDENETQRPSSNRKTKVLILGAGVAGITAAKTLTEAGLDDFLMIEGSNRIGGRVKSVKFGGKTIEAGANWMIVKEKRNPLWNTIVKYNISGVRLDDIKIRNMNGEDVTDSEGEEAWQKLEAVQHKLKSLSKEIDEGFVEDMSLRACLDLCMWYPVTPVEKIVEIIEYDFEYGNLPDVTSCGGASRISDYLHDSYYVADSSGYESILTNMAGEIFSKDDPRLIFNEVVKDINYSSKGVSITTQKGRTFEADHAIMTFSMGVLKSQTVTFNPPLPDWKMHSLAKIRMENYINIYLKFAQTQFWDSSSFILYADERRLYFPVWINHNSKKMMQEGNNILQIVATGEEADRISLLPEAEVVAEVMSLLRHVYKDHDIAEPVDVYITDWKHDPLYVGAFANVEPGMFQQASEALKAPVGRLYFAGEAYSDMDGYTTGAAFSGEDNARLVLSCVLHNTCYIFNPRTSKTEVEQFDFNRTNYFGLSILHMILIALLSWTCNSYLFHSKK